MAGQERRICWRLPSWFEQPGSLHKPLGLSLVQCLESRSVLYRPDSILAVITALLTSKGLPAWNQIGWGLERDIKAGLKNSREGRISASALSFCSKKSVTLDLHLVFHWYLVGGSWRTMSGSGRSYFLEISLTVRNHEDLEEDVLVAERRMCLPCYCLCRISFGPCLAIMPSRPSILR